MPASVKVSSSADGSHRSSRGPLAIGQWLVDPRSNELRRGSDVVRLEPKAMDVLMLLAERAGRPVTRDELFTAAWPGVVVGDEALTQTINKLRKAFGDASRSPSYIETIAKRGYRLIADVRPWPVDAAPSEAMQVGATSGPAPAGATFEPAQRAATPGQASIPVPAPSSPAARK